MGFIVVVNGDVINVVSKSRGRLLHVGFVVKDYFVVGEKLIEKFNGLAVVSLFNICQVDFQSTFMGLLDKLALLLCMTFYFLDQRENFEFGFFETFD